MGRKKSRKSRSKRQNNQIPKKKKGEKTHHSENLAVKEFAISNIVDQSDTNPDQDSVKKNGYDKDPNEKIKKKRKRKVVKETLKNVEKTNDTKKTDNKPSKRKLKENRPQDHNDYKIDCQKNEICDIVPNTQLNSENKSSEERIELHTKESSEREKTINHDQKRKSKSINENTEPHSKKSRKPKPKNYQEGNQGKIILRKNEIVDEVPNTHLNTKDESLEKSAANLLKKSRSRRRRKSKKNETNDVVPSTKFSNESRSFDDWNEVQSRKLKRIHNQKYHQDHDSEMEWQKNTIADRSKNQSKYCSKENLDTSLHRRDELQKRDQGNSHRENQSRFSSHSRSNDRYSCSAHQNYYNHSRSNDRNSYSTYQNDHEHSRRNDRKFYYSRQNNNSQKYDRTSYPFRREDDSRHEHKNSNEHGFSNRNSRNCYDFQMDGKVKKKSNKQSLYVTNAEYYRPTIREIEGDLFDSGEDYALGHCVAEDFCMGAGIAIEFKKRFKGVQDLLKQNKRVGEVAILKRGNRFIFYIVTKVRSQGKPTIQSFIKAIKSLKECCLELNVKKLAIPRIGCGLDKLDWDER